MLSRPDLHWTTRKILRESPLINLIKTQIIWTLSLHLLANQQFLYYSQPVWTQKESQRREIINGQLTFGTFCNISIHICLNRYLGWVFFYHFQDKVLQIFSLKWQNCNFESQLVDVGLCRGHKWSWSQVDGLKSLVALAVWKQTKASFLFAWFRDLKLLVSSVQVQKSQITSQYKQQVYYVILSWPVWRIGIMQKALC